MKSDLTFIAVVLDRSGSMASVVDDTIGGFNAFLDEQRKAPGEALFTLAQFDNEYEVLADGVKIGSVKPLTRETYVPRGGTALLDAIGRTVDSVGRKLAAIPETQRPSKVLVMIQTDGHENASHEYSRGRIADMIKHQRDVYDWDFVFIGASEQAVAYAEAMGIYSNSTMQYDSHDPVGTSNIIRTMSANAVNYRSNKLAGQAFDFFNKTGGSGTTP